MKQSVLLFEVNYDLFDFSKWPVEGVCVTQKNMFSSKIPRIMLKLLRNINKYTTRLTLGDWFSEKKKYDCVVIPDIFFNRNVLELLSQRKLSLKIILYYRNRINTTDIKDIEYAKNKGFIIATYSMEDAEKYDLAFIPQCWNMRIINGINYTINNDVYFLGEAKSRYHQLLNIKNICESYGLSTNFQIIDNSNLPHTQSERVGYPEAVNYILSSKAIIDVVTEENWGLTLRPLEALMSRKKLITNYNDIKQYDFYHENRENIFIIGEDDWREIYSFVNAPFVCSGDLISQYDNEFWLKKIIELH